MSGFYLVKNGSADQAFELRDVTLPAIQNDEILIEVEAFGLNYADVMARLGQYRDCPPLPTVIGYDVIGTIQEKGKDIHHLEVGDRVASMTRFGGYASHAVSKGLAAIKVEKDLDVTQGLALATQYATAWVCAYHSVKLYNGDQVLIHAAAGGVGTALVQMAKSIGCKIYGTAGSDQKLDYLRQLGVDYPINYQTQDFENIVSAQGAKMDVVFDSVGGKVYKKSKRLLDKGGRIVIYGASSSTGGGLFKMLGLAWNFGFSSPVPLIMQSKGTLGVNMLRLADHKPQVLAAAMTSIQKMLKENTIQPQVGRVFASSELAQAHEFLQSRQSVGKIGIKW